LRTESAAGDDLRFAGVLSRVTALVADVVLLACVFFPVTRAVKGTWLMSASDHRWTSGWFVTDPLCLAFLVVMFAYFVLLEGLVGATLGKRLLHLRVVTTSGGPVGLPRALTRNALRVVDSLPTLGILGGILIACTGERTRVGDIVAGSRVVTVAPGVVRKGGRTAGQREVV
jgi:uncharacterized RDD family membrane protein YckC